ncbi:MAG: hypothetical protein ACT4O0_02985 [Pseudonocardia sp.]|jgi:hypothetical protein
MRYVMLAVASDLEAERLVQDLAENPGTPLLTPRWANAVHATLVTEPLAGANTILAGAAVSPGPAPGPGRRVHAA